MGDRLKCFFFPTLPFVMCHVGFFLSHTSCRGKAVFFRLCVCVCLTSDSCVEQSLICILSKQIKNRQEKKHKQYPSAAFELCRSIINVLVTAVSYVVVVLVGTG